MRFGLGLGLEFEVSGKGRNQGCGEWLVKSGG